MTLVHSNTLHDAKNMHLLVNKYQSCIDSNDNSLNSSHLLSRHLLTYMAILRILVTFSSSFYSSLDNKAQLSTWHERIGSTSNVLSVLGNISKAFLVLCPFAETYQTIYDTNIYRSYSNLLASTTTPADFISLKISVFHAPAESIGL